MVRKIYITGLFLLFAVKLFAAEEINPTGVFRSANEFYSNGNYEQAIKLYKEVLSTNHESAALYFNLGNAYYKTNEFTAAILYYEKALRMNPADEDTRFNLKLANLKTVDKIEPLPELPIIKWWNSLIYANSADSWAWLCIQALFLSLLVFIIFFTARKTLLKKLGFYMGILFLIVSVLSFTLGQQQKNQLTKQDQAIVFAPSLTVNSSPIDNGNKLFVIHEGTKVNVLDSSGDWKKISLANGNVGWVKAETLETI